MKKKQVLAMSLAALLTATPAITLADAIEKTEGVENVKLVKEEVKGEYHSFEGKIKSVTKTEDKYTLLVEGKEDEDLILHVSEDVFVDDMTLTKENKRMHLKEGANIIAFYPKNTPVALSLPAQLTPEALIVLNSEHPMFVKMDKFDEDLVSSDKKLKLNYEKEEADKFKNETLIVYYDVTTKSIPAQTSPKHVVIMPEKKLKETEKEDIKEGEKFITVLDRIKINGNEVPMSMYRKSKEVVMVPLRDLTEALGYDIKWNGKEKPIEIHKGAQWTSIMLGKNEYSFARMAPITLESAPELKDSKTYVPASFIEKILQVDTFDVKDGLLIVE